MKGYPGLEEEEIEIDDDGWGRGEDDEIDGLNEDNKPPGLLVLFELVKELEELLLELLLPPLLLMTTLVLVWGWWWWWWRFAGVGEQSIIIIWDWDDAEVDVDELFESQSHLRFTPEMKMERNFIKLDIKLSNYRIFCFDR